MDYVLLAFQKADNMFTAHSIKYTNVQIYDVFVNSHSGDCQNHGHDSGNSAVRGGYC
jgi:hypothetical protein